MSEVLEQKMDQVLERLDSLEEEIQEVKAGKQPDSYYKITEDGNPTEATVNILREVKSGSKLEGITTSQLQAILQEQGFEYTREGTRNVMQRLSREYDKLKYVSRRGAKGSEIQWHP